MDDRYFGPVIHVRWTTSKRGNTRGVGQAAKPRAWRVRVIPAGRHPKSMVVPVFQADLRASLCSQGAFGTLSHFRRVALFTPGFACDMKARTIVIVAVALISAIAIPQYTAASEATEN